MMLHIFIPRHTIVARYYGIILSVHVSICLSVCHPGVSIFVEFHILRAISVYSVMGLNLHCGVKKIGVVGL